MRGLAIIETILLPVAAVVLLWLVRSGEAQLVYNETGYIVYSIAI